MENIIKKVDQEYLGFSKVQDFYVVPKALALYTISLRIRKRNMVAKLTERKIRQIVRDKNKEPEHSKDSL